MSRLVLFTALALAHAQWSCSSSLPTLLVSSNHRTNAPLEAADAIELPGPAPTDGPIAIYSNTTHVEALAGRGQALWVATRGGLEEYDIARHARVATYTTLAGLPTLALESVTLTADGLPVVTTTRQRCTMYGPTRRFACVNHSSAMPRLPTSNATEQIEGSAVTARYQSPDGREWFGTAGLGVWERKANQLRRLTPTQQLVGNHIVAIAEWKQTVYLANFDGGLGRLGRGQFAETVLDSHMLNDVIATPNALYVAASDGLYESLDGEHFRRETRLTEPFVSDLAYDPQRHVLYATATNSLWELRLGTAKQPPQSTYLPGGSHSLQAVDVSADGTVYLATEDRGVLRRDGKHRFASFDRLTGYPSSWATDVLAIDNGSALFGSLNQGVFAIGSSLPNGFTAPNPWVLFLGRDTLDPARLFIGTQGGASLISPNHRSDLQGLPNPCVHAITRLSSGLWVGTEGGLAQYR